MIEFIHGTIELPDKIDITDPCYNRDVWCRINNFPIPPGTYTCYTVNANNEETGGWGERIARIGIRSEIANHYEQKGSIGVDAGLAGFFNAKPDYNREEWREICDEISGKDVMLNEKSFFASSGYGDGSYPVYAGYKDGKLVEVCIEFIGEDEDEDEEEY